MFYLKYVLYICVHKKTNDMEYKIVSGDSPNELTTKVNELLKDGWKLSGSHQVTTRREQNRYSGSQHMDTLYQIEYTQTLIKD